MPQLPNSQNEIRQKRKYNTKVYDVGNGQTCYLDIWHTNNFTGQRRGKGRRWELPFWGKLNNVSR